MGDIRWEAEVAKAIIQLAQEVHSLNPGVSFDFDFDLIGSVLDDAPPKDDG